MNSYYSDNNKLQMSIVHLIRHKREESGMSQEKLAAHLGISLVAYSRLERGKGDLDMRTLAKLMSLLGFTIYVGAKWKYVFEDNTILFLAPAVWM